MADGSGPGVPLNREVTIGMRLHAPEPQAARVQVLAALSQLPSVTRVVAELSEGESQLWLTTPSMAALLSDLAAAPTFAEAEVSWAEDTGLVLRLPGAEDVEPAATDTPTLYIPPRTVAMVIPAHNEAAVIAATLRSVLKVYKPQDVYVFCDGCTDDTVAICRKYLPAGNVIDHKVNVGKSRGLEYTLTNYIYPRGYKYVTIGDADTTIEPNFLVATP